MVWYLKGYWLLKKVVIFAKFKLFHYLFGEPIKKFSFAILIKNVIIVISEGTLRWFIVFKSRDFPKQNDAWNADKVIDANILEYPTDKVVID